MQVKTRIPVSLDLSVVVSQTTGPRDIPHRSGLESGTGTLAPQSRGPVPRCRTTRPKTISAHANSAHIKLSPGCKTRPMPTQPNLSFINRQLVPHFRGIEVCVFYHLLTARFAPRIKYPYPFVHIEFYHG